MKPSSRRPASRSAPIATPPNHQPSIAIVGAGLAGLTLAKRLQAEGLRATVFDKGRGLAGRMSTRVTQDGHAFDHGAQYFTAREERFRDAVAEWCAAGVVAEWGAGVGALHGGTFTPEPPGKTRFVGVPGNNAACLHLSGGLDVRPQTAVGAAERSGDGWRLSDGDGNPLGGFDWFVSSAPAPQSAALLAGAPALAERAAAARMTGCWSAMVAFDTPLGLPYGGAFVEPSGSGNNPLSWIANDTSKPGRPTSDRSAERWVLHGSPDWSEANLELHPAEATPLLLDAFWQATGLPPRPTTHERGHRWRYALPAAPLAEGCLFDPDLRVGACGDWCGGPRVEGAFLSGLALAERLLAAVA